MHRFDKSTLFSLTRRQICNRPKSVEKQNKEKHIRLGKLRYRRERDRSSELVLPAGERYPLV